MKDKEYENKLRLLKYRLAMVHKLTYHPFVYPDIATSLKKRNYSLQDIPRITGARAYVNGYIAMKDRCLIETDNERKIIAAEGDDKEKVIEIMKDLILMSQEEFGMNMDQDLYYMELITDFILSTDKSPIEVFGKFKLPFLEGLSKILDTESILFGVRLSPAVGLPSSKEWYEIEIIPRFTKPDKEYYISIIYRSEDTKKTLDFSKRINDTIISIINLIEDI